MSFGISLYRQDASGLIEADRAAVCEALARWGWDGSPGSPYQIGTPDGVSAEFYASGLDGDGPFLGGNLEVRGESDELWRLAFDVARAGRFVVTHDGDGGVIVVDEDVAVELGPGRAR